MNWIVWLWILWAAVTACFCVVMVWRSLTSFKEEDVIILSPAESKQVAEQKYIIDKVVRLTRWAKGLGFTSLGLLVVAGGLALYRGLYALNSGGNP